MQSRTGVVFNIWLRSWLNTSVIQVEWNNDITFENVIYFLSSSFPTNIRKQLVVFNNELWASLWFLYSASKTFQMRKLHSRKNWLLKAKKALQHFLISREQGQDVIVTPTSCCWLTVDIFCLHFKKVWKF